MKKVLFAAVALFLSISAHAESDIKVSACSKDPALLRVEITGESAMQIYRFIANDVHLSLVEMGSGSLSHGMNCRPIWTSGDVTGAVCSYVMKGSKNIPYPQVDPGFSHEEIINCD